MKLRKETQELTKLKKNFKKSPKNLQNFVLPALEQLSFMISEATKLATQIEEAGWSEEYQNGANQKGKKRSVAGESYLALMQRYSALFKTVSDLIPKEEEGADEFEQFTNNNS